jgi:hypothetical protein
MSILNVVILVALLTSEKLKAFDAIIDLTDIAHMSLNKKLGVGTAASLQGVWCVTPGMTVEPSPLLDLRKRAKVVSVCERQRNGESPLLRDMLQRTPIVWATWCRL